MSKKMISKVSNHADLLSWGNWLRNSAIWQFSDWTGDGPRWRDADTLTAKAWHLMTDGREQKKKPHSGARLSGTFWTSLTTGPFLGSSPCSQLFFSSLEVLGTQ
jgi:hypothetical protein